MDPVTTIACVLRSGGDFDARWVHALAEGVRRHLVAPHRFVCLTDMRVEGVETIPLGHDWPGWWAKLNMLDPTVLTGRVLAFDLDTLPVGNFYRLAVHSHRFGMLGALSEKKRKRGVMVSGVLAYEAGPGTYAASLFDAFRERADDWMESYRGDGEWLEAHADSPEVIQHALPEGFIRSFKWECRRKVPEGTVLVCGHGTPRFSDPEAGWAHREWSERIQDFQQRRAA